MTTPPLPALRAGRSLAIGDARAHRSKLLDVGKRLSAVRGVLQDRGEVELAVSVAESQDGLAWVVAELTELLARVADEAGEETNRG